MKIPARYIDDFVHYVYMDRSENLAIASRDNPLSLMELLMEEAPAYLRSKEEEGVSVDFPSEKN